jgi:lipoyl(octanoyl) transferase
MRNAECGVRNGSRERRSSEPARGIERRPAIPHSEFRIPHSGLRWYLDADPVGRPGAENMAIDEALLSDADQTGRAYLRLYRWDPPCLSLGRNEPARARYDRSAVERLGWDVVRRPTGGRTVWHEHEVTYAVAAPVAAFGGVRAAYYAIHERLAKALRTLGVQATLASARPAARPPARPAACFAAAVGGEILVAGRKLVGSAQMRRGTAFLQHGSILLDGSQDVVGAVSCRPSAVSHATTLREALGRPVTFEEVAETIVAMWGVGTQGAPLDLTPPALPVRPRPSPSVFSDPEWTWRH